MGLGEFLGRVTAALTGAKMLADALGLKAEQEAPRPIAGSTGRLAPVVAIKGAKLTNHDVRNIDQRVALIVGLVQRGASDPDIIAKAREIVSRKCKQGRNGKEDWCIPARDWRAEIVAVHNEVKDRLVRYTRDPDGVDFFAGAKRVMAMGGADCDEMVSLEGALLRAIGFPVELVVVETVNAPIKGEYEHVFLVSAYEDADGKQHGVWLDPTVREKPAGWRVPESMCVREKSYAVP